MLFEIREKVQMYLHRDFISKKRYRMLLSSAFRFRSSWPANKQIKFHLLQIDSSITVHAITIASHSDCVKMDLRQLA